MRLQIELILKNVFVLISRKGFKLHTAANVCKEMQDCHAIYRDDVDTTNESYKLFSPRNCTLFLQGDEQTKVYFDSSKFKKQKGKS